MDRTERFYKIEMLIRHRRSDSALVSFNELMEELGVSRATLKRDLDYLRDRMDAPIVYDRFYNGYKFEGTARTPHALPGVWFSEREIHALLTMHQLIQGLDEGGVLARHLQPLLDKLYGMLGASDSESKALMERIHIASPARRPVPVRHFELIGQALMQRLRVDMSYFVRTRSELTQRSVSPQRLVYYRNTWYLDAWCHVSEGLRRFALDAVREARLSETPALDVPMKTVRAQLDSGYGVFAGGTKQWATLRFTPEAALWVAQEQWHAEQKGRWLDDGAYELELPYVDATELLMDLMRHGDDVRVLSPPALREALRSRLRSAAAQYDEPPAV